MADQNSNASSNTRLPNTRPNIARQPVIARPTNTFESQFVQNLVAQQSRQDLPNVQGVQNVTYANVQQPTRIVSLSPVRHNVGNVNVSNVPPKSPRTNVVIQNQTIINALTKPRVVQTSGPLQVTVPCGAATTTSTNMYPPHPPPSYSMSIMNNPSSMVTCMSPISPSGIISPSKKRIKLDVGETNKLNDIHNIHSLQMRLLEHHALEMQNFKASYKEMLSELFFNLHQSGDQVEFAIWRKKAPSADLQEFMRLNALETNSEVYQNRNNTSPSSPTVEQLLKLQQPKLSTSSVTTTGTNTNINSNVSANPSLNPIKSTVKTNFDSKFADSLRVDAKSRIVAEYKIPPKEQSEAIDSPKNAQRPKILVANNYATTNQEQIVEKAKQEAYVMQRINELQREGLWTDKRLPKLQEPARPKVHWDYLLEEMVWLSADFAQERKWKKAAAKKCARMIQKYFQEKSLAAVKEQKAQELQMKRIAACIAKEIRGFWANVGKVVEFKQKTRLEEKRKQALDQHLSFIVDQTEKYSQLLAEDMNKSLKKTDHSHNVSRQSSIGSEKSDDEFNPDSQMSDDDEETIAQAEAGDLEDKNYSQEIEDLQRESQLELDDVLSQLPPGYLEQLRADNGDTDGEINVMSDDSDTDCESDAKKPRLDNTSNKRIEKDDSDTDMESQDNDQDIADQDATTDMDEDDDDGDNDKDSNSVHNEEGVKDEGDLKTLFDENLAKDDLNDVAALAESIQPKGNTLSSTRVVTQVPFILKHTLREYQHIGLDWLVTMYERRLNGILADEMGLGKTIQTIALLANLACSKGIWGPHLIIVPTSVMLNWEMEFKKWCPAFKILTYYGSIKERKVKRVGWTRPNSFHVCITSYKLVVQDQQSFRRKKWQYLILDEAQNIKNFKSQRWQLLLNFQTEQRLLLTGTPLQNHLMELWSLMHFLMPHVFSSHREFREWFSNPVTGMIEGNSEYNEGIIKRLHKVLRPFLLRRLKCEVEKQMPQKYEHVIMCRLSKRQRYLYDDFMSRTKTRETLAAGNFLSVINILMQLRKVCNHPNLFEVRPTVSPFQMQRIDYHTASLVYGLLDPDPINKIDLASLNLLLIKTEMEQQALNAHRMSELATPRKLIEEIDSVEVRTEPKCPRAAVANCYIERPVKKTGDSSDIGNTMQSANIKIAVPSSPSNKVACRIVNGPGGQLQIISGNGKTPVKGGAKSQGLQILQTPTGKQILLASSSPQLHSITTTGGQKLTVLSKSPILASKSDGTQQRYVATTVDGRTILTTQMTNASGFQAKIIGTKNLDSIKLDQKNKSTDNLEFLNPNIEKQRSVSRKQKLSSLALINSNRTNSYPLYGEDLRKAVSVFEPSNPFEDHPAFRNDEPWTAKGIRYCNNAYTNQSSFWCRTNELIRFKTVADYINDLKPILDRFIFVVPPVQSPPIKFHVSHPPPAKLWHEQRTQMIMRNELTTLFTPLHSIVRNMMTQFPDPRLIQFDCGKLQTLDRLLRNLKVDNHRVLIFTQMTRMLDVLEAFLNYHGHIYLRLDGTTKVDQRQMLMERFNNDKRIFVFILSTRSGGVGINLTGADTVIFYDSDWNPTMDAQAQDRCHRIGQTRDVHIYRLVSEKTIEENILRKANQKRILGDLAIEGGNFTTAYFKSSTIQELFKIDANDDANVRMADIIQKNTDADVDVPIDAGVVAGKSSTNDKDEPEEKRVVAGALETALAACEDEQDVQACRTAKAEAVAELAEFDETIPLEEENDAVEPEISKAEQELQNLVSQLTPVERYAMRFVEENEAVWAAQQLAAAEAEIEAQKREWEAKHLEAERLAAEKREEMEDSDDEDVPLTYSHEDATNQVNNNSKRKRRRAFSGRRKNSGSRGKTKGKVKNPSTNPNLSPTKSSKQIKRSLFGPSDSTETKTTPENVKASSTRSTVSRKRTLRPLSGKNMSNNSILSPPDDTIKTSTPIVEKTEKSAANKRTPVKFDAKPDAKSKISPILDNSNVSASRLTRSRGNVNINLWELDKIKIGSVDLEMQYKLNAEKSDDKSDFNNYNLRIKSKQIETLKKRFNSKNTRKNNRIFCQRKRSRVLRRLREIRKKGKFVVFNFTPKIKTKFDLNNFHVNNSILKFKNIRIKNIAVGKNTEKIRDGAKIHEEIVSRLTKKTVQVKLLDCMKVYSNISDKSNSVVSLNLNKVAKSLKNLKKTSDFNKITNYFSRVGGKHDHSDDTLHSNQNDSVNSTNIEQIEGVDNLESSQTLSNHNSNVDLTEIIDKNINSNETCESKNHDSIVDEVGVTKNQTLPTTLPVNSFRGRLVSLNGPNLRNLPSRRASLDQTIRTVMVNNIDEARKTYKKSNLIVEVTKKIQHQQCDVSISTISNINNHSDVVGISTDDDDLSESNDKNEKIINSNRRTIVALTKNHKISLDAKMSASEISDRGVNEIVDDELLLNDGVS